MSIAIHEGSILEVEADVIVNPANSFLRHDGGLARVIADAAAPRRNQPDRQVGFTVYLPSEYLSEPTLSEWRRDVAWADEQAAAPLIATGNVHLTSAGVMPFKAVAHVVGPIWNGGDFMERDLLEVAHDNTFEVIARAGHKSVVLPAISCGVFGFPVAEAAPIAVGVAAWWAEELSITFALTDPEHVAAYRLHQSLVPAK